MASSDALRLLVCGALAQLCLACAQTTYEAYDAQGEELPPHFERKVGFQIARDYFRKPPECLLILPLRGAEDQALTLAVEESLERYLRQRVGRVVGPLERGRERRARALDLSRSADQLRLARALNCDSLVEATVFRARDDFFLIWAERTLGLEAVIVRAENRTLLWRARHTGIRSDGGVPTSIASAAVVTALAARHANDPDIEPSLIDDVVRRLTLALPDVR